LWCESSGCQV